MNIMITKLIFKSETLVRNKYDNTIETEQKFGKMCRNYK